MSEVKDYEERDTTRVAVGSYLEGLSRDRADRIIEFLTVVTPNDGLMAGAVYFSTAGGECYFMYSQKDSREVSCDLINRDSYEAAVKTFQRTKDADMNPFFRRIIPI